MPPISSAITPVISGDKSPPKIEDKPNDDKTPLKSEEKSKSPIDATKQTPKDYSGDVSDKKFVIPKPQDKPLESFKTDFSSITTDVTTTSQVFDTKQTLITSTVTELREEKAPVEAEDKPKSPIDTIKSIAKDYSDDESDEEFGIPKPVEKPIQPIPSAITPVIPGDKSPLKTDDKPKDDKTPLKTEEKPKSPIDATKPTPKDFSDDERDEEFGFPKPVEKPIQPIPFAITPVIPGDKSALKTDDKPQDDKTLIKSEEKPKSSIDAIKQTPKDYSGDVSDKKFVIPKPQDKPVESFKTDFSSITTDVTTTSQVFDTKQTLITSTVTELREEKAPVKAEDKPKDDKTPLKTEEKPKSPIVATKQTPKDYLDDESDEEFVISTPQDKPVDPFKTDFSSTTTDVTTTSQVFDTKQTLITSTVTELREEKAPVKAEEKPKSPIHTIKSIAKDYSDDESDEEFGIPKPVEKPIQPIPSAITPVIPGVKSPLKTDDKPKDDKTPLKTEEKPKSSIDATKQTPKDFSDDERDEEFGFPKPVEKPIQPIPFAITPVIPGDKSALKTDDKPQDDKTLIKSEEKPKSSIDAIKQTPKDYSGDVSDKKFVIPKPQDKPVESFKTDFSSITTDVTTTSQVFDTKQTLITSTVTELREEKAPVKAEEKPKSPIHTIKSIAKDYSDDESDKEFGIPKPIEKPIQPIPSAITPVIPGVKSPLKTDDKPKDDTTPLKSEEKPKSPSDVTKLAPKNYSDDESDEEFGIPKPIEKPIQPIPSAITPVIPGDKSPLKTDDKPKDDKTPAITPVIPGVKSPLKTDDKPKDDKTPLKSEEKPKSSIDATKQTPKDYSDDESDEEFVNPKPQDKPVESFKTDFSSTTTDVTTTSQVFDTKQTLITSTVTELREEKAPVKAEEKPKSPIHTIKSIAKDYSDDESDEEFGIPKPVEKPIQPIPSAITPVIPGDKSPLKTDDKPKDDKTPAITPVIPGVKSPLKTDDKPKDDKTPLKSEEKPKSSIDATKQTPKDYSDDESDEEFVNPKPQDKPVESFKTDFSSTTTDVTTTSQVSDTKQTLITSTVTELREEKAPVKAEEKPKSPIHTIKSIAKDYSDDESDEEFGIPKPVEKPIQPIPSAITPVIPGDKSPLKTDDKPKDDTTPLKSEEKPISPIDATKPAPKDYSDDESAEEFVNPKPQDKPVESFKTDFSSITTDVTTTSQVFDTKQTLITSTVTELREEKAPVKAEEKPKLSIHTIKSIAKDYSDDESDEEFGIPKPVEKPIQPIPSAITPVIPRDKSPHKTDDKPKDDKSLLKSEEKPISPIDATKPAPKDYFDDESDEEFVNPKPQDKPVESFKTDISSTTTDVTTTSQVFDTKQTLITSTVTELREEKAPVKAEEKPKSPIHTIKSIAKDYSDDESDEEFGIPKPVEKPIQPIPSAITPVIPGVKSPLKTDDKPKDDTTPLKSEEKPKSPIDATKPAPKDYSDDESDEEFGIPKPVEKPIQPIQPIPSAITPVIPGVKSPLKTDDKPKDDTTPLKSEEKPKSPIDAKKPTPEDYSDDESDEEFVNPKPQDKPVESFKTDISSTTTDVTTTSQVFDTKQTLITSTVTELREEKAPVKAEEKPKSPIHTIKSIAKDYSDDESDEEFGIPKPVEKPIQPIPSAITPVIPGDKSPLRTDDKPKDDTTPFKSEEKPKSPIDATKPTPKDYSDDEGDEEFGIPKPVEKPIQPIPSAITPVIPGDKSPHKTDDKPKDDKTPLKSEEKPKYPIDATKQTPKDYSDDESDEDFGIPKPVKKPIQPIPSAITPVIPGDKSPLTTDDKPKDDKTSLKPEEKPKSPIDATKPTPKDYSDDESDEDFGIPKPVEKPIQPIPSAITPVIPGVKSPLKTDDKPKDDTIPLKSEEKPKSPIDATKPTPKDYSDNESDEEFVIPKPVEKPIQPIPSAIAPVIPGVKSPPKTDDKPKDDKTPLKSEEKPKSPIDATKQTPKDYSDDESDEEFGIPKPVEKPIQPIPSAITPVIPGDKSPLKTDDKPKDDKTPLKSEEKPKSPIDATKQTPKDYFDDESDEEFVNPKPQDKPVESFKTDISSTTTDVTTTSQVFDTKQTLITSTVTELREEKAPVKAEEKPKSPIHTIKSIAKDYSDDESDKEFGIPKPVEKPIQPIPSAITPVILGVKSPLKTDDKPKDDTTPLKTEEKPMSPIDATKPTLKDYSDDETDEEFGIPKPVEKPIQPIPSAITPVIPGVKSPLKTDDKPKDDKTPFKSEEKPKSPIDATKPTPKDYSDDESDEEFVIPKPVEKPIQPIPSAISPVIPGVKSPLKTDDKPKDDTTPLKTEEKPKSPIDATKPTRKDYSDDESEEEFGIPKPVEKPIQPIPSAITPVIPGVKSPLKTDDKPKDDTTPLKTEEKPKSPIDATKPTRKDYSDDESEEEFGIPKPVEKPIQPIPSAITPVIPGVKSPLKTDDKPKDDKTPLKSEEKPKSPIDATKQTPKDYFDDESDEEFVNPKPQDKPVESFKTDISSTTTDVTTTSQVFDTKQTLITSTVTELREEKAPVKAEEKPKSPIHTIKSIAKDYSDDESDEEFDIPKPVEKPIQPMPSAITPVIPGVKSPLKTEDKPKDDTIPLKSEEKPKSPIDATKPTPKDYSDDESDEEFGIPKPVEKPIQPIQPIPSAITPVIPGVKSPLKTDDKPKDDTTPLKTEEKPLSPIDATKPTPKDYSDDESDEEFDIPKPVEKPIQPMPSAITPVIPGVKSPLKTDDKPKDDKTPFKSEEKPKSPIDATKPTPKDYSDDESDEEFVIPKPVEKPIQPIPSAISPVIPGVKSPLKTDDKPKDDTTPLKTEEKPKSPIDATKPTRKDYSDDESEEEFGIPKPVEKPIQPIPSAITPVIPGVKSPLKTDDKPKDDKTPFKSEEKPKSPIDATKPTRKDYSDDESEEEFGIPKPVEKPIQPIPSAITPVIPGVKSPLKTDDKPKDDKTPLKSEEKPKSPIDATKPTRKDYSDDESEEEFGIPKPVEKPIQPIPSAITPVIPGVKSPLKTDDKPKDDKTPFKSEEKPKSPIDATKPTPKDYSDDESDEEFGIPKPVEKPIQPIPSAITPVIPGVKSPLKTDDKPKDDKTPLKSEEKPKSPIDATKQTPKDYFDDESDEEFVNPKPQDKPVESFKTDISSTTTDVTTTSQVFDTKQTLITSTVTELREEKAPVKAEEKPKSPIHTIKSIAKDYSDDESDEEFDIPKPVEKPIQPMPSAITPVIPGVKSPLKTEDKPKDDTIPLKSEEKPKSPIDATKPTPKDYSDDESDEEFGIPKPVEKPIQPIQPIPSAITPVIPGVKSPLKTDDKPKDDTTPLKTEEKPLSPIDATKPTPKDYSDDESDEEFDIPKPVEKPIQPMPSAITPVILGVKSPLKTDDKPKDDTIPLKTEEKPLSPIDATKPTRKDYSDDESEEEFGIPKPVEKPIQPMPSAITPVIPGVKSPLKTDDKPKDDTTPLKTEEKPLSPIDATKPTPKDYSDDESDEEFDIPKPVEKPIQPIQPIPSAITPVIPGVKSPLKTEDKPKDDTIPLKSEEKPKSPIDATKPTPKDYSDDESDEEFGIPKPVEKPIQPIQPIPSAITPVIPGVKSPLKTDDKPKDDTTPLKTEEKPLSPIDATKPTPKDYSDDESDEEFGIPKPVEKPIQPIPSAITPVIPGVKSPPKTDDKPKDDTTPLKTEEKPLSPIDATKPTPKDYSDDESDEEFGIPKPVEKPIQPIQPIPSAITPVIPGVKSPLKTDDKPKDDTTPLKTEEKPLSPIDATKPTPKDYSDDESDEEFDIPKPVEKPIQPMPSAITPVIPGVKSPLKTEDKPKDDTIPLKSEEKPKSPIDATKPTPKDYSDNESDEEFGIRKPVEKPLQPIPSAITPVIPGVKSPLKTDDKPKDDTTPLKTEEKPLSPIDATKPTPKDYSDNKSDEEFVIPKPVEKPIQPIPSAITPVIPGVKSLPKTDDKPKDDTTPFKSEEKPKSPIDATKQTPKDYSDNESDEEFVIPKPVEKPIQPIPSAITPVIPGVKSLPKTDDNSKDDKTPLKSDEKPKSPIDASKQTPKDYSDNESDEEFVIPKPVEKPIQPIPSAITPVIPGVKSLPKTDDKPKDDKAPLKSEEKPKSPIDATKRTPKDYFDDESDEEFVNPKPQDKPVESFKTDFSSTTTDVTTTSQVFDTKQTLITSTVTELREEKAPVKAEEKPKSPIHTIKSIAKDYSDDESDEDFDIPKPVEKPLQPIPSAITPVIPGVKSPLKTEDKPKDDTIPLKSEEKPKSPIDATKPALKDYSDNESDEEFVIPKPVEKPIQPIPSAITPVIPGVKSPLKTDDKPKDDTTPLKSEEKPKSAIDATKPALKDYSDDESDEEFVIPKPVEKPIQPIPSAITPVIPGVKSPPKTDDKPKDDTTPLKSEEKPKSPIDATKPTPKDYSDNESDEEFGIRKPVEKPLQPIPSAITPVIPGVKSPPKTDDKPKDDTTPFKSEEKPKSPIDATKQTPKDYSDNESDEEFVIPKPVEKPIQPIPSAITPVIPGDKSPLKTDDKPKDDTTPLKSEEKPKSPIDATNPTPKDYSDDESDEEFGIPKPVEKPIPSAITPVIPGDKSPLKTDDKPKDDTTPLKSEEKPKSPIDATKQTPKDYSDNESDEEFVIPKPVEKPIQPIPSAITPVIPGVKSLPKTDDNSKDDKTPLKSDEKPKSPIDASKQTPKDYSDNKSDEEFVIPKPVEKPIQPMPSAITPVIPGVKSPLKTDDKPKDDTIPLKSEEKPKSPIDATKQTPKDYFDDESDEEFVNPKPQDKPVESFKTDFSSTTTDVTTTSQVFDTKQTLITSTVTELREEKAPLKAEDKPKSPIDATKPTPKDYSDDESDEEFVNPKPQDKPVESFKTDISSTTTDVTTTSQVFDTKQTLITSTVTELREEKAPVKAEDKPKSPIDTIKSIAKDYSDDESDKEFGIPKPVEKPIQPIPSVITPVIPGDKSPLKTDDKPKDDTTPLKSEEKPKSPIDATKPTPKDYSDDESDEEFVIPKPVEKPIQPIPSTITPVIPGDKSPLKTDDKPKDDTTPLKSEEKPKSPIDATKPTPKDYSDDESDEEFGIPKPVEKPIQPIPSAITPVIPGDKSPLKTDDKPKDDTTPLKSEEKPKSPIDATKPTPKDYSDDESDEEFVIPKPVEKPIQPIPSTITPVIPGVKSPLKTDDKPKDDKTPLKSEEKPKSPIDATKPTPKDYSDDESDEEFGIPKPVEKPIQPIPSAITPVIPGVKSPLKTDDKPKDDKTPLKSEEKPKSPIDATKPTPKDYSDDESDEEFVIPKPVEKPIQPIPSTITPVIPGVKSPLKTDDKPKDDTTPLKSEEKPKSPIDATKPTPKDYSDDESDEEFVIPKPVEKPIQPIPSTITPVIPGVKSPLKTDDKPKDDTTPLKSEEKPKSPIDATKPTPKDYSDDESDEEFVIPKPVEKPIQPIPSTITPVIPGVKSPLKTDDKPKDDTTPLKSEEKPKSPIDATKPTPKDYSDDESDEEFVIPKPVEKPIQPIPSTITPVIPGVKSPLKTDDKPKDDKTPLKSEEKPKPPIDTTKPTPKDYSDDESDEEFGIPKPVEKPIQPIPSAITPVIPGVKSPLKTDDKPKDDTTPLKSEEKPKSAIDATKPTPKDYSDDESDEEFVNPKPQDKPIESFKTDFSSTTTDVTTTSQVFDTKQTLITSTVTELREEKAPVKAEDKPKSPIDTIKSIAKDYSDDESDKEFGIPKPVEKPIQPIPSTITPVIPGDKSPLKTDDKPKDDTTPLKSEEKPKSPIDATKPTPKDYSDDESDEEFGIPKPVEKPIQPIPSTITPVIPGDKSPLKTDDKPKDDTTPLKSEEKPKSPIDATKPTPKDYSDDESDEEFGIPKPVEKPIQPIPSAITPVIPGVKSPLKTDDKPKDDTTPLKSEEKPKSAIDATKPTPKDYSDDESDEEFVNPKPQDKPVESFKTDFSSTTTDVTTTSQVFDTKQTLITSTVTELREEKAPVKAEDKPKSPIDTIKSIAKDYSDDESDKEFGIPKPVEKPIQPIPSVITPVIPGDKSPLKTDDKPKDDTTPLKSEEKPKSAIDATKPTPKDYSDDESDEEFVNPKPQDKPVESFKTDFSSTTTDVTTTSQVFDTKQTLITSTVTELREEKAPVKAEEKPKSPIDTTKSIAKDYSDDESDEEFGIPKPVEKPIQPIPSAITPVIPGVKSPLKTDDKPKDDTTPLKSEEKPKSAIDATKPTPKDYSDDESDEEFVNPKPQDKPVESFKTDFSSTTTDVTTTSQVFDTKQTLITSTVTELREEKAPVKAEDKPKSPIDTIKSIAKDYSDDESDKEFGIPKPVEKPIQPIPSVITPVIPGDKSPLKTDDKPKDDTTPLKSEEKPKSPIDATKPTPKDYSDDESDEEFGIPKPVEKPIQPIPSAITPVIPGVKSPLKTDDKPKDDTTPLKSEEKPKSAIDATKPTPKDYSDDESDEEFVNPKPQDKPVESFKTDFSSTTTDVTTTSQVFDTKQTLITSTVTELREEKAPVKAEDKPKSPIDTIKSIAKDYSDDESDKEFGIPKPVEKPIQPIPSVITPVIPGDKSPLKTDDKPKDDTTPLKSEEKPKSAIDATKPTPKDYSDDESDEEFVNPKPQDKPVESFKTDFSSTTTDVTTTSQVFDTKQTLITSTVTELREEKAPVKAEDKPKSPIDTIKSIAKDYSDDESDKEFGIPKPAEKPIQPIPSAITPVIPGDKSPLKTDDKPKDDTTPLKSEEKPKSPIDATKPTPKVYLVDESDEEFVNPKPQDKPVESFKTDISSTTTDVTTTSQVFDTKQTLITSTVTELREEKAPVKAEEKPKSPIHTIKSIAKDYSDDESDEDFGIPKPVEKPIQPIPAAITPVIPGVKSPLKTDDKPKDDTTSLKSEEKPKSSIDATKPSPKDYSDDESDIECVIPKPQDKPVDPFRADISSTTTISTVKSTSQVLDTKQTLITSTVTELREEKDPVKAEDKPKSPIDTIKSIAKDYSDDESDEDFGIPKPVEKPIQPIPAAITPVIPGVKSPLKTDDKPKDDTTSLKSEEKPKSSIDATKPSPKDYSDDESDIECVIPKPQDKPVDPFRADISSTTTISTVKSTSQVLDTKQTLITSTVTELREEKDPVKAEDKPKSPIDTIKSIAKDYSDDESDEEFGVAKHIEKPIQPIPLLVTPVIPGDMSLLKSHEKQNENDEKLMSSIVTDIPIMKNCEGVKVDAEFGVSDDNRSVQQIVEDTLREGDAEVQKIVDQTLRNVQLHKRLHPSDQEAMNVDNRTVEQIVEETLKAANIEFNESKEKIEHSTGVDDKVLGKSTEDVSLREVRPIAYFVNLDEEQKISSTLKKESVITQTKLTKKADSSLKSKPRKEVSLRSRSLVTRKTQAKTDDKIKSKNFIERPGIRHDFEDKSKKQIDTLSRPKTAVKKALSAKQRVPTKPESRRSVTSSTSTTTSSVSAASRVISEIHFERSSSPASSSIFYESHPQGENSRSTTPRPRVKTDVTQIPYNTSIRSFSPPIKTKHVAQATTKS
ncbi:uncharacterized protein Dwil_GK27061, partial [Drosophila willistoni]